MAAGHSTSCQSQHGIAISHPLEPIRPRRRTAQQHLSTHETAVRIIQTTKTHLILFVMQIRKVLLSLLGSHT
jgi:hypothetical protein